MGISLETEHKRTAIITVPLTVLQLSAMGLEAYRGNISSVVFFGLSLAATGAMATHAIMELRKIQANKRKQQGYVDIQNRSADNWFRYHDGADSDPTGRYDVGPAATGSGEMNGPRPVSSSDPKGDREDQDANDNAPRHIGDGHVGQPPDH